MVDDKCSKRYPRAFQEFTNMDNESYPLYRRGNNGHTVNVSGHSMSNQRIVPYCPFLSSKYNCHINLEVCSSIKAIKYIFKYVYKGGDRTVMEINADEIQLHLKSRYIDASEAACHIFRFPMHCESPNVVRLSVHLPEQQSIIFNPDNDAEQIQNQADKAVSTLMGFFKANAAYPAQAGTLTYQEFPS